MIEQQKVVRAGGGYNEVVLDARPWVSRLPTTIEAMFVLPSSTEQNLAYVREVHQKFLETFRLSKDTGPPIVLYDPGADALMPFTLHRLRQ